MVNLQHGQKAELARRCGYSRAYVTAVLNGTRSASPRAATNMVHHAAQMGIDLTREQLIYPEER
jgi:transcriptional regulator with XRE-family HTH domain